MRVAALLTIVLLLAGCGGSSGTPAASGGSGKLKVVATTTQLQDIAKNVLGDKVTLIGILTADADPHEYQPTADDVKNIADADIVLRSGVELEKWMDKLVANSGTRATIVDCSQGIMLRKGDAAEPVGDPHIWFNPANTKLMVHNIVTAASIKDSADAATFQTNELAYDKQLDDLDSYIKNAWATKIPNPTDRKLVANHDAFGYYIDRYNINFVGSVIPSMDTNYSPSAQDIATLEQKIKAQQVKAIFVESSLNPKLAQQIASDTGVTVVDGKLYGDTLGPAGSPGETYLKMIRYDTDLMIAGMTGQPLPTSATQPLLISPGRTTIRPYSPLPELRGGLGYNSLPELRGGKEGRDGNSN